MTVGCPLGMDRPDDDVSVDILESWIGVETAWANGTRPGDPSSAKCSMFPTPGQMIELQCLAIDQGRRNSPKQA